MKTNNHHSTPSVIQAILVILSLSVASCSDESVSPDLSTVTGSFTLSYTVPDSRTAEVPQSRASVDYVIAVGNESRVADLQLLFFENDDHGNGTYITGLSATPKQATTGTSEKTDVTYTAATGIDEATDYRVLVVANLGQYLTGTEITDLLATCAGKTENRVKMELLPVISTTKATGGILNGGDALYLLMSGETVKSAGKDMQVELLRASVRIDVEVAEEKASTITLTSALLMNVAPDVPLFRNPRETYSTDRLSTQTSIATDNRFTGQLHCTESYLDMSDGDSGKKLFGSTCLIVNATNTAIDYTGAANGKTWYRLDLVTGDDGIQYLKRNNAYTVVIKDITAAGCTTAEEAYYSDATLITGVTIPSGWNASGEVPPTVDVN